MKERGKLQLTLEFTASFRTINEGKRIVLCGVVAVISVLILFDFLNYITTLV